MKKVYQIEQQYNELLEEVRSHEFFTKIDLTNRINCYLCTKCSHITKTKDVDAGVIPFMSVCEDCGESATSSFFKDIAPDQKPTIEWYRPSLEEVLENMNNDNYLYHIFHGGLIDREIKSPE